jgi:hypothetical protein
VARPALPATRTRCRRSAPQVAPVGLEREPGDEFVAVVEVGAGTDAGQQVQALQTEEVGQWFCPTQG